MGKIKYVGCKVEGCLNPHRSRGYCRKHYRQITGECKRRYLKVKSDSKLLGVLKNAVSRYRKTDAYRQSKAKSDKKYYESNIKKIKEYKSEWNELKRFGIKREIILKRDNYKCTHCSSPIIDDLIIHHIDGKGRSTDTPNNDLSNLITLCRACHIIIHSPHSVTSEK